MVAEANAPADALTGAGIVVTRPEGRGEALCRHIVAAGGEALFFPTIAIHPLPVPALPEEVPDWLVFASRAAVEHGLPRLRPHLTAATRLAAIGAATAAALAGQGLRVDAVPEREESEDLLALDAFQDIAERRVWIVRGGEGRTLLADTLHARGAHVFCIDVYERRRPTHDATELLAWWHADRVHALVVSSRAGLENLHAMLDAEGRSFLQRTQLVVPTARMLKLAHDFAIRPAPVVAAGASDDALLATLVHWWRRRHSQDSR